MAWQIIALFIRCSAISWINLCHSLSTKNLSHKSEICQVYTNTIALIITFQFIEGRFDNQFYGFILLERKSHMNMNVCLNPFILIVQISLFWWQNILWHKAWWDLGKRILDCEKFQKWEMQMLPMPCTARSFMPEEDKFRFEQISNMKSWPVSHVNKAESAAVFANW